MGNQVVRKAEGSAKKPTTPILPNNLTPKTMSRSPSGADFESNFVTHFKPVEKLSKILAERSHHEEDTHGISKDVFVKYLFPRYPDLGARLFKHLYDSSKATTKHLGASAFKQQVEKMLSIMNDRTILDVYVKMYSNDEGEVTHETLRELLMISYQLATDSESTSCVYVHRTIQAVISSCFHGKENLSTCFVSNWLWQHCSRVVYGVHRYVVHMISTAYRNGKALLSTDELQLHMEPVTPVLEKTIAFDQPENLLPLSHVWILATSLPSCYIEADDPNESTATLTSKLSGNPCPRHWTLLYDSDQNGSGANRFLHHTLGYRGPTIVFIKADIGTTEYVTYCICSSIEWRESHLYWGGEDSVILQLLPSYKIIEKGPKLLYLNTGIRGYPQGLRAGKDPKEPFVNIDQSFNSVSFGNAPHRITTIQAWGCGDHKSRERQLEIKKWQVKEAEKQRVVKMSAAEWIDHPDRYLLELAGRPVYNNGDS